MHAVAKFEKVSIETFKNSMTPLYKSEINDIYDDIRLPHRSTEHSAGYDFIAPYDIKIPFGSSLIIKTGIKVKIKDDWFLALFPRSGHGFKYGIEISNTIGVVDGDYYNNQANEGHILVKITNKDNTNGEKTFKVKKGEAFCQGVFLPYGVTVDDDQYDKETRNGGFGSTGGLN